MVSYPAPAMLPTSSSFRPLRLCLLPLLFAATTAHADTATVPRTGIRDNTPRVTAITGATIHVAPGRTIAAGTLVLRDGWVVAVGPAATTAVPGDAVRLALPGAHVYAGFVDPYSDYGLAAKDAAAGASDEGGGRQGPQYDGTQAGARSWNDAVHAERRWVEEVAPDREAAKALLASGVTVVQSARLDGIFRGRAVTLSLAPGAVGEVVLLPEARQFAAFDKGSSKQSYPSSLMGSIALIRQTLLDAGWWQASRAAADRNPLLHPVTADAAVMALAADDGPLLFDSGDEQSLLRAARIGQELRRGLIHVGSDREYVVAGEVAALGQVVILPATLPRKPDLAAPGSEREVALARLRQWERAPCNAGVLVARGVPVAFSAHGLAAGEELLANVRRRIACGLAADAALAALTTVPAGVADVAAEVGTLDAGRRANLVIADGDLFVPAPSPWGAAAKAPVKDAEASTEPSPRVVSTWIDGRSVWEAPRDWRGSWTLSLAGQAITLEVAGDAAAPRATFRGPASAAPSGVESDATAAKPAEVTARNLAAGDTRLDLAVDLETLGVSGLRRLSLIDLSSAASPRLRERQAVLAARAEWADGSLTTLEPVAVAPVAAHGALSTASAPTVRKVPTLLSHTTFPDTAFGFASPPRPEDVVVRHAKVWTSGPAGVLADADLFVRGGKVVAVGRDLAVPADVREIDGRGKQVTPGIIDEHSHLAISGGVNEGSYADTAEVRIGDVVDAQDVGVYRALAGGTTTAQLLHGSANPIGGQAQIVKHRWGSSAEAMKLAGAPPTIKFALGENVKQANWGDRFTTRYPQTRMGVDTLMRDHFLAAREYAAGWARYRALPEKERARVVPPRRDLELETLAEILAGQRFIHAHSYVQSEILALMRLAEELGFRVQTFTHILEGYKVASEMARHGASASGFADWWAYKAEVLDAIPYSPCVMHDRGVVTSVNSDSPESIRRLNQEAGKAVAYCGMSEVEALAMATINPAQQLRIADRVGSLEPGKDADFVIWSGNPLSVESRVEQTWVDGTRLFDLATDRELRARDAAEKAALVAAVLGTEGGDVGAEPKVPAPSNWNCETVEDYWHARR
jgi:imidazolonepropionase-like amidohydrolase